MEYLNPNIDGYMTEAELQWIYKEASRMTSILEIGSWKGRSTHAMLCGCKGPVFAVDNFKGSPLEIETNHKDAKTLNIYKIFHENVGHFENLSVLRMDHKQASGFFRPRSVDMVFIDGAHGRGDVIADIQNWMPVSRILFCGHDLTDPVVKGVLDDLKIKYTQGPDSLWYVDVYYDQFKNDYSISQFIRGPGEIGEESGWRVPK